MGGGHPDVRVRRILDFASDSKALQFLGENVEHGGSRDESGGAEWDFEFIASSVIVSESLRIAAGNVERIESGDFRWGEIVEGSINVPAVESSVSEVVFWWDDGLVEGAVVRMLELGLDTCTLSSSRIRRAQNENGRNAVGKLVSGSIVIIRVIWPRKEIRMTDLR